MLVCHPHRQDNLLGKVRGEERREERGEERGEGRGEERGERRGEERGEERGGKREEDQFSVGHCVMLSGRLGQTVLAQKTSLCKTIIKCQS